MPGPNTGPLMRRYQRTRAVGVAAALASDGAIDKPANGLLVNGFLEKDDFVRFFEFSKGPINSFFVCRINFGSSHDNNIKFLIFGSRIGAELEPNTVDPPKRS